jgi:uncharacterized protein (DUF2236 family)
MSGVFANSSMIRRVHRERAVALSGPRALLMQAAHPLAVSGLLAHSSALEEPYDRLSRTAEMMSTITFGEAAEIEQMTARVRAMHARVNGRLGSAVGSYPHGTPYRADDPELLLWVLFTLVDSALEVYQRYVGALSRDEQEAFWQDYRLVGELFGLCPPEMPDDLAELEAYREEMLTGDRLYVGDWARERAREIVLDPPVPIAARPLVQMVNFITIALLPAPLRSAYGFASLPPAPVRSAIVIGGAAYVKRAVIPLLPASLRFVPMAQQAA